MIKTIDRYELVRLLDDQSVQLVDVLPDAEYQKSHIPGAVSIPLRTLDEETTRNLDRGKPVVVYCHDGL